MIYLVMGRSGTDKTNIVELITQIYTEIISKTLICDTTRNIKFYEKGYCHKTNSEFHQLKVEYKNDYISTLMGDDIMYASWYGVNIQGMDIVNNDYICIAEPEIFNLFKGRYPKQTIGLLITMNDRELLINCLKKDFRLSGYHICQRFIEEDSNFSYIERLSVKEDLYRVDGEYLPLAVDKICKIIYSIKRGELP